MTQQQKLAAIRAQLEQAEQQRKAIAPKASPLDRAALDAHIASLSAAYAKAALR
jgi:hypothetical protein